MKNLSKAFLLVCFLGFCYSRAMGASALVSEIEREYKTFSGLRIPNVAEQPCMAVQYICYLQAHGGRDAAAKIALVIGSGVGVGGISNREATPAERALMVRGINFAVREKIQESGFNLELKDFSDHVGQHQKIVAQLIESSQRVQILVLKDVERNEMYYKAFPKAPVLHPYNFEIRGDVSSSARKFDTASVRALLPESLQQQVAGIPNGNLEIFWNTQSYIRPNSEIAGSSPDLLYRPQYWLDPDAPLAAADYSKGFAPAISFWQTSTGVTINHNSGVFQDGSFSTHTGADNLIVSSEANCSIEAFITGNRGKSLAFWSLISYGGRNALTLHWLLSSEDNINLTGAIRGIKDMKELGKLIAAHPSLGRLYHFAF